MSELDDDAAVRPVEGGWVGEIVSRWNIGDNPNGGYTLALGANAMLASAGRPDPLTVTAHYVAPPAMGPVAIRTETVRAGRRYATVSASMLQGGRELIRLLGAFGDLDAHRGPTRIGAAPPPIPPPEDCVRMLEQSDFGGGRPIPEIMGRYDLRLDPGCQWVRSRTSTGGPAGSGAAGDGGRGPGMGCGPAGSGAAGQAGLAGTSAGSSPSGGRVADTADGGPVGPLEVNGWIRFADGAPPSVVGLLAMADAFPPTMVGSVDVGWVPTVELTVHLRRRPAPGWILGAFRTRFLIDGVLEQDGELWDSSGHPVALCRQMALVLPKR